MIDYYHDEDGVVQDKVPKSLTDVNSMKSIKVDVRPAVDSIDSIIDRLVWMPFKVYFGKTKYNPPEFFPNYQLKLKDNNKLKDTNTEEINKLQNEIKTIENKCNTYKNQLKTCSNDTECHGIQLLLQRCVGSVICPEIVTKFDELLKVNNLNNENDEKIELAFDNINSCVKDFQIKIKENK